MDHGWAIHLLYYIQQILLLYRCCYYLCNVRPIFPITNKWMRSKYKHTHIYISNSNLALCSESITQNKYHDDDHALSSVPSFRIGNYLKDDINIFTYKGIICKRIYLALIYWFGLHTHIYYIRIEYLSCKTRITLPTKCKHR